MYKYTLLKTSTWNLVSSFIVFLLLVGNANLRSHLLPFDAKSPGFVPWPNPQFHIFVFGCLQFSTWKHNHSRTQKSKLAFLIRQSHFWMSFMWEISCICSHHINWSPSSPCVWTLTCISSHYFCGSVFPLSLSHHFHFQLTDLISLSSLWKITCISSHYIFGSVLSSFPFTSLSLSVDRINLSQ